MCKYNDYCEKMVKIEKNTSFYIANNCQIIGKSFVSKIILAIFAL